MHIVKIHATRSTNDEMRLRFRESTPEHLSTIYTMKQTHGKGQHGNSWESEPYKNLAFSTVVKNIHAFRNPFELNKIASVALVEWLDAHLKIQAKIKWPNDILSVNHKLAGMLIENFYQGAAYSHSIVGIGLNVNQTDFHSAPKAISLCDLTGTTYDLEDLLISFLEHLKKALEQPKKTASRYQDWMFKQGQSTSFIKNGSPFKAKVLGVDLLGRLMLQTDTETLAFNTKEISWVY